VQIYTKILIGMAVGAIGGLTLGPSSSMLEHDLYQARSGVEIRLDRDDAGSKLVLPKVLNSKRAEVPHDLRVIEVVKGEVKDKAGKAHAVPRWVKVRGEINERVALSDRSRGFRKATGKRVGETYEAWLRIDYVQLDDRVQSKLTPVSALGTAIVTWTAPVGDLFMRMLKMVIVPLVFASLLCGVAGLGDVRKLGRMGGRTFGIYLLTTAVAVTIGLLCAHVISPGDFVDAADKAKLIAQFEGSAAGKAGSAAAAPSTMENILAIVPTNPIASLSQGNMLQIIFFAVIFGIALTMLGEGEGRVVVTFFDKVQNAMVVVIHIVMSIAPYGVAALVLKVIGTSGASVLGALLVYSVAVVVGLLLHAAIVYGLIVKVIARLSLFDFLKAIRPAQLIAFSTSSSSATLPVSLEVAEENLNISKATSSFVLPLGSTVNMDGTALYQGVAAVFIAQVFGMDLTIGDQLAIVLAATMASVGAAGVPGAGMVTLAMVLTASGIPEVGLALILGMDRLLDMFRTAINVTGDLSVTAAIAVTEGETLRVMSPQQDSADPDHGFEGRLEHEDEPLDPDKG